MLKVLFGTNSGCKKVNKMLTNKRNSNETDTHASRSGMENIVIFSKISKISDIFDIFDIFDIYRIFSIFSFYCVGLGDVN